MNEQPLIDSSKEKILSLAQETQFAPNGIVSRTVFRTATSRVVLFGFAAGQELSEHTAAVPAIVHILRGQARLRLGSDEHEAGEGAWARMPARLPHSVLARTPVVMLLLLLKSAADQPANT